MLAVIVLVLTTVDAILAQIYLGDLCGEDIGQITLISDCKTAIAVPHINEDKNNWCSNSSMVCCINSFYLKPTASGPTRKSEIACAKFGPGIQRKISSANYVQPGDYQHDVALGYWNFTGDGTMTWGAASAVLISKNYVLTNAHCIQAPKGPPKTVRIGTIDLMGEEDRVKPQDIEILETVVHPGYSTITRMNDIGLIKLAKPAIFTLYVQPACLFTKKYIPAKMVVTGWGRILSTDWGNNDLLLKSTLVTVDKKQCNEDYPSVFRQGIPDSYYCGLTGSHICSTSSGSPAFLTKGDDSRATVVGLSTYGNKCGSKIPTIYIKISSYLDWIESIVWP